MITLQDYKGKRLETLYKSESPNPTHLLDLIVDNINKSFNSGILSEQETEKAIEQFESLLEKARPTKYYKRIGVPGNYQYFYTKEEYDKYMKNKGYSESKANKPDLSKQMSKEELYAYADELFSQIPQNERDKISKAKNALFEKTDTFHKNIDKSGNFTKERLKIQKDNVYSKYNKAIKSLEGQTERKVVFMAGLPASGKTTATKNLFKPISKNPDILQDNDGHKYLVLNADDVKGMLPEYNGLNAAELHEESSFINKVLQKRAVDKGISVVIDGTFTNAEKGIKQHGMFKENGYSSQFIHVDVKPQTSLKRAKERYDRSGRFVPFEVIIDGSEGLSKATKAAKKHFDKYQIINND